MEFRFRTEFYSLVKDILIHQGFRYDQALDNALGSFTINFQTDEQIRELRQWSAAAFACGLIESPRIERM